MAVHRKKSPIDIYNQQERIKAEIYRRVQERGGNATQTDIDRVHRVENAGDKYVRRMLRSKQVNKIRDVRQKEMSGKSGKSYTKAYANMINEVNNTRLSRSVYMAEG